MGYLYALFATILWSGNAVAARFLAESVPPIGVSFWRWFVALLICVPWTYASFRKDLPLVKKHWRYLIILAFLGITLFNTLLYTAAHTTSAFNIAVISTAVPVFILVFSFFFAGERLSRLGLFGFLMATLGLLSLITDGHPVRILELKVAIGDLIMLIAAGVFASYSVLVRKKPAKISVNALIFTTFVAGFIMLLPLYIIQEIWFTPTLLGVQQIGVFLYIGVFASFVSFMFWNRAIGMIGAAKTGAVYYSIPIFTGFLGFILLGEAITIIDIFSMLAVGFGVYLTGKK
ncbi:MAG: EamA/RhaT family transporter [Denitrovibrio sp.]|nr:MAG: EamA/RhaT family transporter [Denitrovibrio sp.]